MTSRTVLLAVPLAALLGCSSDVGGGDEPTGEAASGTYALTSHLDLSSAPGVPEQAGEAVVALTGLAENPAATMFDLLDEANVPVLDQLLGAIPDILVDQVAGWIDDYIADRVFEGVPAADLIAGIAGDLAAGLTDFETQTELDLAVDADGAAGANHILSGVAFQLDGARRLVDTPALLEQLASARDVACDLAGAELEIGSHAFRLPLGDLLVVGMNQAISAKFGVPNLRAALGLIVDCTAMAQSVSSRCVGPVCVGHESEIEGVCDAGLDQVAQRIEDRLAAVDYAALHFIAGHASMVGEVAGGLVDRLDPGMWQVGLDLDGSELPIDAPFSGARTEQ